MTCHSCNAALRASARFCTVCGAGVVAVAEEPDRPIASSQPVGRCACGQALRPGDGFCTFCGQPATSARTSSASAPPAAAPGEDRSAPCAACGAPLQASAPFCRVCGHAAQTQTQTQSPTPAEPRPPQRPITPTHLVDSWWARLDDYASLDKLEGFSLREMFSEVLKKRTPDEVDDYFVVGSYKTTPRLEEVSTAWPKPWFFSRVLAFIVVLYLGQIFALRQFNNPLVLPGLIVTGSLAMPLAIAFLFFELNVPRNISFHRVLMLACSGGVLSILISLIGFDVSRLSYLLGAPAAGVVEESGKLLAVLIMTRKMDKRFILNGCLFGASVGAGFAAFESAGYAFVSLLQQTSYGTVQINVDAMASSILQRGVLAPFGHEPWTAIAAGGLWRASVNYQSQWEALTDRRFLRTLAVAMALHAAWNLFAGIGGVVSLAGFAVVGVSTWYIVFGIVQQGLKQVRAAQVATTAWTARATSNSSDNAVA